MKNRRGCLIGLFGCGGVVLVCAVVFAFSARSAVGMLANLTGGESTDGLLEEVAETEISVPEVIVSNNGDPIDEVTINVDGNEQVLDLSATNPVRAEQTTDDTGEPVIYIEYNEADLNELLLANLDGNVDPAVADQVRNLAIDLRPNAIVVTGEANTPIGWQEIGIVGVVDPETNQIRITGVDIAGFLLPVDQVGEYATVITQVEDDINQQIQEATFTAPNGQPYTIDQLVLTDETLQIIAR